MANSLIQVRGIKGLVPALEPKEMQQPFVVDGRNFAMDFEGPYSAFSHMVSSYTPLDSPELVQTLQVESETYICTSSGIYGYDVVNMSYYPKYLFPAVSTKYPWSMAQVGGFYYFCRRDVGVIQHDYTNRKWVVVSSPYLPNNPAYITNSYGRLIVLGDNAVVWSSLDNGLDFVTSLETGAGYQGLSIVRGTPLGIREIANGFLTFTSQGIMISEFIGTAAVFQHRKLTTTDQLLNPFCLVTTSELTHVFLTRQGFRVTDGKVPDVFEPLFNQFLFRKVFPNFEILNQTMFRMFYSQERQSFFLSIASSAYPTKYSKAYVFNTTRQEWGSFDENHYGIGEFYFGSGPYAGYNLGYIDFDGFSHYMTGALPYKEVVPDINDNIIIYRKPTETETHFAEGVCIATSRFHMTAVDEQGFKNYPSGLYTVAYTSTGYSPAVMPAPVGTVFVGWADWNTDTSGDEDWLLVTGAEDWLDGEECAISYGAMGMQSNVVSRSFAPIDKQLTALDSYVTVGVFRFIENKFPDEVNILTNVAVGMYGNNGTATNEDWNTFSPTVAEDYAGSNGLSEDWGFSYPSNLSYSMSVLGSFDGVAYDYVETPALVQDKNSVEYYSCYTSGIYHAVTFSANNLFEYIHLKHLELSGFISGRL